MIQRGLTLAAPVVIRCCVRETIETPMRVRDDLLDCCFFIGAKTATSGREQYQYGGTGFFVSVPTTVLPQQHYIYLVTALHNTVNAANAGSPHIRLNTKTSGTLDLPVQWEWLYPENDGADVAVAEWPAEQLRDKPEVDYRHIPSSMFVTLETIEDYEIGVGEEIVITGLFTSRSGRQRNLPIVRTGILSRMADEPLVDDYGNQYPALLAEVRSIGGLSGSPVFAVVEAARSKSFDPTGISPRQLLLEREGLLVGMVRGHWNYDLGPSYADYVTDDHDTLNSGIAIITPIGEVQAIIERPDVVKQRIAYETELAKRLENRA